MTRPEGRSAKDVGQSNKRLVLERLLDAPDGLTRPEVAQAVGLTTSAIGTLVGDGGSLRNVVDSMRDPNRSRGTGRQPEVIRVKQRLGHVLGIVLNHTKVRVALADLQGTYDDKQTRTEPWPVEKDLHGALALAAKLGKKLAEENELKPEDIAAIGLAIAAPVHVLDGALPNEHRALLRVDLGPEGHAPPWLKIDPLAAMTSHLAALPDGKRWRSIPVHVDNDANLGALAELKQGAGRGSENLLYVRVEERGIGAGLVFGGRIYRGAGIAGELGHVVLDPQSKVKCSRCGRPCVEAAIGAMFGYRDGSREPPLGEIVRRALEEDPATVASIKKAARYLGRALAGFVTLLNVDRILIGGAFPPQSFRFVIPPITDALDKFAITPVGTDSVLALGELQDDAVLIGAIWLALERARVDYLLRCAGAP
jgi:predicted NBD/HSP70 family sugar kinase